MPNRLTKLMLYSGDTVQALAGGADMVCPTAAKSSCCWFPARIAPVRDPGYTLALIAARCAGQAAAGRCRPPMPTSTTYNTRHRVPPRGRIASLRVASAACQAEQQKKHQREGTRPALRRSVAAAVPERRYASVSIGPVDAAA